MIFTKQNYLIILLFSTSWSSRSIGLNREAEMIEQQLKAKQGGQPTPASVVSGKI